MPFTELGSKKIENTPKPRTRINEGNSAQRIMDAFGVKKPMLKSSLARLIQLDGKFYKIAGMDGRAVTGSPVFKKTGLHLSATLLKNYGFREGDEFRFSLTEEGKIVLEKV